MRSANGVSNGHLCQHDASYSPIITDGYTVCELHCSVGLSLRTEHSTRVLLAVTYVF